MYVCILEIVHSTCVDVLNIDLLSGYPSTGIEYTVQWETLARFLIRQIGNLQKIAKFKSAIFYSDVI